MYIPNVDQFLDFLNENRQVRLGEMDMRHWDAIMFYVWRDVFVMMNSS